MINQIGARTGPPRLTAAHFSLAVIGLMWTLPFLQPFHRIPLTSFYSEWLALTLGLLALAALARGPFWRAAPLPVIVLPLLAFIVVLAIQHATGRIAYGGQALLAGFYMAWTVMLVILARGLRREIDLDGIAVVLAWFLAVGGAVSALFALLQHYQISDLPHTLITPKKVAVVYGNLAQYNHFANYSTLALASLAFLYAGRRLHWAGAAVGAAPLLYVIGLSGSRSALLFLAGLLVLALLYWWRGGAAGRRLGACVVLFIAGFALMQWLATLPWLESGGGTETVTHRLTGGEGSSGAVNIAHRFHIAREAWAMFMQSPLLGVGWGQFPLNDFEFRALHGGSLSTWPFNHAHNIVLQLLAETGVAGTVCVVAAAMLWLWGLRKATADLAHWWLLALAGVIALHSLLEHPLWYAYFLGIAAVGLGLVSSDNLTLRLERAGPPLLSLTLIVAVLYAVSLLLNYRDFERLFAHGAVEPGSQAFSAIVSRAHREPVLAPYAELAIAASMALDRERLGEKRAINNRVLRFAPSAGVVYRQAILLALDGEPTSALRELDRAARVYPDDLEAAIKIMGGAATRHPAELAPLIKSASVRLDERRAARAPR
jgi:O-antigen ligase